MKLTVNNLSFDYKNNSVLKDINFEFNSGELIAILGKNGAGKSTLFKLLLGILKPKTGSIFIDDKNISSLSSKEISRLISYIPQLQPKNFNYTVEEMILMGTAPYLNFFENPNKHSYTLVDSVINDLKFDFLRYKSFNSLSGGEKQLVLIARALVGDSKILIMDEPCSNLDYGNQIKILKYAKNLAQKGYLVIFSTHNPEHTIFYSDISLMIKDGKILDYGLTKSVVTEENLHKLYNVKTKIVHLKEFNQNIVVPIINDK